MSKEVFTWDKKEYSFAPDKLAQNKLGWQITNGGHLSMKANDGEWYNFPPDSIDSIIFLKPYLQLFYIMHLTN